MYINGNVRDIRFFNNVISLDYGKNCKNIEFNGNSYQNNIYLINPTTKIKLFGTFSITMTSLSI